MRLETSRLCLREYHPSDWQRVHLYAADADFSRFELWGPNSEDDTKKFIADKILQGSPDLNEQFEYDFAVCLRENDLLIGGCGIRRDSEFSPVANLGWAIHPDFQNRGFATECARALLDFGFEELKLELIYATCDTRNSASFAVMEKIGMKRTALLKGDKMQKGHLRDTFRYELLPNGRAPGGPGKGEPAR